MAAGRGVAGRAVGATVGWWLPRAGPEAAAAGPTGAGAGVLLATLVSARAGGATFGASARAGVAGFLSFLTRVGGGSAVLRLFAWAVWTSARSLLGRSPRSQML